MAVKLMIASMVVGMLAAIINLICGYGGRFWVMHSTLATAMQFASVVNVLKHKRRYGTL
jgi:hypothetical protein